MKELAKCKASKECIDFISKVSYPFCFLNFICAQLLEKDPVKRLGTRRGPVEVKAHAFFKGTDWTKVYNRQIEMPEAYLAQMALDIIEQQPYLVAGHPHTTGAVCPREH